MQAVHAVALCSASTHHISPEPAASTDQRRHASRTSTTTTTSATQTLSYPRQEQQNDTEATSTKQNTQPHKPHARVWTRRRVRKHSPAPRAPKWRDWPPPPASPWPASSSRWRPPPADGRASRRRWPPSLPPSPSPPRSGSHERAQSGGEGGRARVGEGGGARTNRLPPSQAKNVHAQHGTEHGNTSDLQAYPR